jgi:hypothetical protein
MATTQGSLGIQKMVLDSGAVALGAPGSLYTVLQSDAITTGGGTLVLGAGIWMICATTNVAVELCTDADTAWITLLASGEGGTVISDGYNVRLNASAGATPQWVGMA